MKRLIITNFWLKILALFLALVIWLYIVGELNKGSPEEKALFFRIMPFRVSAKEVPIKVALIGKPQDGYQVHAEAIIVKPAAYAILAPKSIIRSIDYVTTEDIDIGEFTKSVVKEVRLKPIGGGVILDRHFMVKVVIPVNKIEPPAEVKH